MHSFLATQAWFMCGHGSSGEADDAAAAVTNVNTDAEVG